MPILLGDWGTQEMKRINIQAELCMAGLHRRICESYGNVNPHTLAFVVLLRIILTENIQLYHLLIPVV